MDDRTPWPRDDAVFDGPATEMQHEAPIGSSEIMLEHSLGGVLGGNDEGSLDHAAVRGQLTSRRATHADGTERRSTSPVEAVDLDELSPSDGLDKLHVLGISSSPADEVITLVGGAAFLCGVLRAGDLGPLARPGWHSDLALHRLADDQ
eukprot:6546099-Heterocapsa_arctica.AAC.1